MGERPEKTACRYSHTPPAPPRGRELFTLRSKSHFLILPNFTSDKEGELILGDSYVSQRGMGRGVMN